MFSYFGTPCSSKAKGTIMIGNRAIWILTTISLWPALAASAEETTQIQLQNAKAKIQTLKDTIQLLEKTKKFEAASSSISGD